MKKAFSKLSLLAGISAFAFALAAPSALAEDPFPQPGTAAAPSAVPAADPAGKAVTAADASAKTTIAGAKKKKKHKHKKKAAANPAGTQEAPAAEPAK